MKSVYIISIILYSIFYQMKYTTQTSIKEVIPEVLNITEFNLI
jgi:hypothetical protein